MLDEPFSATFVDDYDLILDQWSTMACSQVSLVSLWNANNNLTIYALWAI